MGTEEDKISHNETASGRTSSEVTDEVRAYYERWLRANYPDWSDRGIKMMLEMELQRESTRQWAEMGLKHYTEAKSQFSNIDEWWWPGSKEANKLYPDWREKK